MFLLFFRDPVGIQTQDLQNRNLTLYSAKLRDLVLKKVVQRYNKKVKLGKAESEIVKELKSFKYYIIYA